MNHDSKNPYPIKVFVFGNDLKLGQEIANYLEEKPAVLNVKIFPDGERIPHQSETVRGCDVFLIFTSQNGPETDKWLMDYLRFVRAVKRGHPYRITVIIPKLPHQRADVTNYKLREPKMSDFYPDMLKAAGADYMIVCKLHNSASDTSSPPMDNVDTTFLFIEEIKKRFPDLSKLAIATGDIGGSKYGRYVANKLDTPLIIVDKDRHPKTGETRAMKVYTYGEISSEINTVVFIDDVISTFSTLKKGAEALNEQHPGISNFCAVATHADFGEETLKNMITSKFNEVWVTNTVPVSDAFAFELKQHGKEMIIISVAKVLAKVIDNVHDSKPISTLWE